MALFVNGKRFKEGTAPTGPLFICAGARERAQALALANIDISAEAPCENSEATRYDTLNAYDYFTINRPAFTGNNGPVHLEGFLNKNSLVIVGAKAPFLPQVAKDYAALVPAEQLPARGIYLLFTRLLEADTPVLEGLEDDIEEMEEQAVKQDPKDCTAAVTTLRKDLLLRKRYYKALYDLLEDMEENQNGFLPRPQLRLVRLHKNRVDRLLNAVISLQDYLSQVREAFQNQLDISLNMTMRIFTVITAVFLPLTLIAGWYGMNLNMPELANEWTYPIICVVSVVIVVGCLWYFKRKGWF